MNVEALIARKMEARRASGLHVRLTYVDNVREPFDYYARDTEARDHFVASANAALGKADPTGLGHVIERVEIVAHG